MLPVKHQHSAWCVVETKIMLGGFRLPLLQGDTVMLLRKNSQCKLSVSPQLLWAVMFVMDCIISPPNLYAESLTPSNSECDSIWRQGL